VPHLVIVCRRIARSTERPRAPPVKVDRSTAAPFLFGRTTQGSQVRPLTTSMNGMGTSPSEGATHAVSATSAPASPFHRRQRSNVMP
jgi:hypothetical protein